MRISDWSSDVCSSDLQHAKAAGVPAIVAINKIDKTEADPSRVKNELLGHDVVDEEFGGDTQMVELSAKSGQGVDALLDAISLQSRSEERSVGNECASTCRSRGSRYHYKKKKRK